MGFKHNIIIFHSLFLCEYQYKPFSIDKWIIGTITRADKVLLLNLRHKKTPQVYRCQAEGELPDSAPLPQPVRQPGQVAVAVQEVGVKPPTKDQTALKLLAGVLTKDTNQSN